MAVLHAVEKAGPRRFTDIAADLGLRPAQTNRALKALVLGRLLEAGIEPGTYPNKVRYALTAAGLMELDQVRQRLKALRRMDGAPFRQEATRLAKVLA